MIRVAFDVNDFRLGVLCLVAEAVHDDAATNGAVRARVACLGGAGQLEVTSLSKHRLWRKAEQRKARSTESGRAGLEKLPTVHVHRDPPSKIPERKSYVDCQRMICCFTRSTNVAREAPRPMSPVLNKYTPLSLFGN